MSEHGWGHSQGCHRGIDDKLNSVQCAWVLSVWPGLVSNTMFWIFAKMPAGCIMLHVVDLLRSPQLCMIARFLGNTGDVRFEFPVGTALWFTTCLQI